MVKIDLKGFLRRDKSSAPRGDAAYEAATSDAVHGPALSDGYLYVRGTVVQVVPEPETGITLNLNEKAYMGLGNGVTMLSRSDPIRPAVTVLGVYRNGEGFRVSEHAYALENGVYQRVGSSYGGAKLFDRGFNTFDSMKGWVHEGRIHPEAKAYFKKEAAAAIKREKGRGQNMQELTSPWKYASLIDAIAELPEDASLPAPPRK
ncbi:MAG: hypothetical protein J4431_00160 [Candidatus Aenigmarchaeota archaeon]|nr:hypothetical protein [Candidatus Aenigmarchaeota archaeon]